MKTDFSKKECDILVGLSDFKPRNQNQMADLIGSREKSTDRVHVSRCLKNIKTYLKRVPNDLDESGTRWVLRYEIQTLRQIAEKYPSIIPDLQNNDKILDLLQDNHPEFHNPGIEISPELREFCKCDPEEIRSYIDKGDRRKFKPLIIPFLEAQNQAFKGDFKNYLRESPTFFKMCLLHDSEPLKDIAQGIHFAFLMGIVEDKKKAKSESDSASSAMLGHIFNWFCRIVDVLYEKRAMPSAFQLLT
ncbi:MAG: hypothetical protein OIN90_04570 [Candidatus Methanoperedens sp.]|nr:hypothetical protein [Candidatus Methanoperedens sp.]